MSPVARCHILYNSHRRVASDLRAMESGAFYAPLADYHPAPNSRIELRFHLPDGLRVDVEGVVMRSIPGRGVTIALHPEHPGLQAMRSAVGRPGFVERMNQEHDNGADPLVTFADPSKTIPAEGANALKQEIRRALAEVRARSKPGNGH